MTGRVDVVVVTYNSADHVPASLEAVRNWSEVASVTVVDNASTDDSVTAVTGLSDRTLALTDNLGFGTAQNRGAAVGSAPYVLILNPDAVIDVDRLAVGLAHLVTHDDVGAVQGEIHRAHDGGLERSSGQSPGLADLVSRLLHLRQILGEARLAGLARRLGAGYFADREVTEPREVDFLAAVAVLARRSALAEVDGFDERFFLYAEDIDLGLRLRGAGWRLVALPGAWAEHIGGASSSGDRRAQRRRWWDAHLLLARLHWTGAHRVAGEVVGRLGRRVDGVFS